MSAINWPLGSGSVILNYGSDPSPYPDPATYYLSKIQKISRQKYFIIFNHLMITLTIYFFKWYDPDPAGSEVNWPGESGSVTHDYGSADPDRKKHLRVHNIAFFSSFPVKLHFS